MAKRWQQRRRRGDSRAFPKKRQNEFVVLDQFSVSDIRKWKNIQNEILKYHWDFYHSLAYQRSKKIDEIKQAIFYAAQRDFNFSGWQRTIKYRYALEPLSVAGSLADLAGGRFNIGQINPQQFTPFPGLYIAEDKSTSLQELLSQNILPGQESASLDVALTNRSSITTVSLSGSLDSIINLHEPDQLEPLVDLIKSFGIPDHMRDTARDIGLTEPSLIKTPAQLVDCLLDPEWRLWPMQFDVPVTSQIFGQLAVDAGVEGILYPSKFTNRDCLVIFPQCFEASSKSYVSLDDASPTGVKVSRLDGLTWEKYRAVLCGSGL